MPDGDLDAFLVALQRKEAEVTVASFDEHIRRKASDAALVFPDVDPLEAAWSLFLVHLEEAVQTAKPDETELVLARDGVRSQPP